MKKKNYKRNRVIFVLFVVMFLVSCANEDLESRCPPDCEYNLSQSANVTGIADLLQNVNDSLMFGYLGVELLIAIFIITFMAFNFATGSGTRSFAASCYISFVSSIFLVSMGILNPMFMITFLILSGVSVFLIKND